MYIFNENAIWKHVVFPISKYKYPNIAEADYPIFSKNFQGNCRLFHLLMTVHQAVAFFDCPLTGKIYFQKVNMKRPTLLLHTVKTKTDRESAQTTWSAESVIVSLKVTISKQSK